MTRRRLLLSTAALAALVILSACGKVRYPTSYLLNLPVPQPRPSTAKPIAGALLVREFRCPDFLCRGRIVYRPSPEEVGFYEFHRWAMDPRRSITDFVADSIRARQIFTRVASVAETGVDAPYLLSGSIERLEEVDRGRDVTAECALSAELVDVRTGEMVWRGRAAESLPVDRRDVPGVVATMAKAAEAAVERLIDSMESDLRTTMQN